MAGKKKASRESRGLYSGLIFGVLLRDDVDGTGAFFALTDIERHRLAFLKVGVAAHLNLRMMNKQLFAAIIGDDESKSFFAVKPLYFTCTHCNSSGPCGPQN